MGDLIQSKFGENKMFSAEQDEKNKVKIMLPFEWNPLCSSNELKSFRFLFFNQ